MSTITDRMDAVMDRAIAERRIVGAVILVKKDGAPAYGRAAGLMDREAKVPMRKDTVFRLASVTKPMVSATALALVEAGTLSLDDPVTRWLPDFRPKLVGGREPEIRIRNLLSHTSGIGYATMEPGDPYRAAGISGGMERRDMAGMMQALAALPLYAAPSSAWRYGMSIDVLGAVIEQATGGKLGDAVATLVTKPLGMTDTGFHVAEKERLAAAYADGVPAVLMSDPHEITAELGEGHASRRRGSLTRPRSSRAVRAWPELPPTSFASSRRFVAAARRS